MPLYEQKRFEKPKMQSKLIKGRIVVSERTDSSEWTALDAAVDTAQ
jgi:hypothetical protein